LVEQGASQGSAEARILTLSKLKGVGAALAAALLAAAAARAGEPSGREVRCLGLVAFTEAAVDGPTGMAAVIRVVRNRTADPRFPDDACAAVAQVAQFQPVARSAVLQKVVRDPEGYDIPQVVGARSPQARRLLLEALRLAREPLRAPDPTGGALYFVDPALMDAGRCPWFAALRRTARIGGHVFLAEHRPGEAPGGPALDCAAAGRAAVAPGRPVVATADGP
jgi:spore germination cell wall hydrolase CwlJ-like protein